MQIIPSLFPTIILLFLISSPPTFASPISTPASSPISTPILLNTTTLSPLPTNPLNATALCLPGPSPPGFGASCEDALADFVQRYMPGPPSTLYDFGTSFPILPHRGTPHRIRLPVKAQSVNCEFRIEAVSRGQHGIMDRSTVGDRGWVLWQGCVHGGRFAGGQWEVDEGVRFAFGVVVKDEAGGGATDGATDGAASSVATA